MLPEPAAVLNPAPARPVEPSAAPRQAPRQRPRPVARIAGVAVHLPERTRDVAEAERELHRRNPKVAPRLPMVSRLTGVRRVHVADDDQQASDLAVAASRTVLDRAGLGPQDVDLLIFASATQDMIEPATSHITAAKLGVRAPVMDVKNACNSVLNGIEVAEALIGTGRYRRVLVACGEMPTRGVRWDVPDRRTYAMSAAGYTMSDAGAAVLVEATGAGSAAAVGSAPRFGGPGAHGRADGFEDDLVAELAELVEPAGRLSGILSSVFAAESQHWDVGMLPGGGTVNPRDPERSYFEIDGSRLRAAFDAFGSAPVEQALAAAGVTMDDVALVAVHQVAVAYLADVHRTLGVPADRTIVTVADHGNIASATLPLQLDTALESGRLRRGDVVLLLGLAGGVSMGAMVVRW
ncbi:3-oxoacyl-ACP synthase III family protein [Promicromonospora iranensis]|uniref:3-oxoacyl-ACP synthase III family protein n=1 Tax=Promicromonospora iranensis TaxID=1105144 RepID=UPI0023A970B1|nr:ketoacyl-ACP synthase III [Promicromonospora iranensis]